MSSLQAFNTSGMVISPSWLTHPLSTGEGITGSAYSSMENCMLNVLISRAFLVGPEQISFTKLTGFVNPAEVYGIIDS